MENIIYKGIKLTLHASGTGITAGTSYTAVLYSSSSNDDNRASVTATASGNPATCDFSFTDTQTAELKNGDVILDIYDNSKNGIAVTKKFAVVEPTSLSN